MKRFSDSKKSSSDGGNASDSLSDSSLRSTSSQASQKDFATTHYMTPGMQMEKASAFSRDKGKSVASSGRKTPETGSTMLSLQDKIGKIELTMRPGGEKWTINFSEQGQLLPESKNQLLAAQKQYQKDIDNAFMSLSSDKSQNLPNIKNMIKEYRKLNDAVLQMLKHDQQTFHEQTLRHEIRESELQNSQDAVQRYEQSQRAQLETFQKQLRNMVPHYGGDPLILGQAYKELMDPLGRELELVSQVLQENQRQQESISKEKGKLIENEQNIIKSISEVEAVYKGSRTLWKTWNREAHKFVPKVPDPEVFWEQLGKKELPESLNWGNPSSDDSDSEKRKGSELSKFTVKSFDIDDLRDYDLSEDLDDPGKKSRVRVPTAIGNRRLTEVSGAGNDCGSNAILTAAHYHPRTRLWQEGWSPERVRRESQRARDFLRTIRWPAPELGQRWMAGPGNMIEMGDEPGANLVAYHQTVGNIPDNVDVIVYDRHTGRDRMHVIAGDVENQRPNPITVFLDYDGEHFYAVDSFSQDSDSLPRDEVQSNVGGKQDSPPHFDESNLVEDWVDDHLFGYHHDKNTLYSDRSSSDESLLNSNDPYNVKTRDLRTESTSVKIGDKIPYDVQTTNDDASESKKDPTSSNPIVPKKMKTRIPTNIQEIKQKRKEKREKSSEKISERKVLIDGNEYSIKIGLGEQKKFVEDFNKEHPESKITESVLSKARHRTKKPKADFRIKIVSDDSLTSKKFPKRKVLVDGNEHTIEEGRGQQKKFVKDFNKRYPESRITEEQLSKALNRGEGKDANARIKILSDEVMLKPLRKKALQTIKVRLGDKDYTGSTKKEVIKKFREDNPDTSASNRSLYKRMQGDNSNKGDKKIRKKRKLEERKVLIDGKEKYTIGAERGSRQKLLDHYNSRYPNGRIDHNHLNRLLNQGTPRVGELTLAPDDVDVMRRKEREEETGAESSQEEGKHTEREA